MTCRDAIDAIARAEAGLLTPDESSALEQHLDDCARCRMERALQARMTAALRARSESPLDSWFTARVLARIRAEQTPWPKASWWTPLIPALALGLAILAIRFVLPFLPLPVGELHSLLRPALGWMEGNLVALDLGRSPFGLAGAIPPYTLPAVVFTACLSAIMVWVTREVYTSWRE